MKLSDIRGLYPTTAALVRRLADQKQIDARACEGLSHYALERMESGDTPERDATLLLVARTESLRRQRK